MAHTPVDPSGGSSVSVNPTEKTELYVWPSADSPEAGDLIPNTGGPIDAMPTRQVTRIPLHNGLDFVAVGILQSETFTVQVFGVATDPQINQLYEAYESGDPMKFNVFYPDGVGVKGFLRVSRAQPQSDPGQNGYWHNITFEPFLVEPIVPATGS